MTNEFSTTEKIESIAFKTNRMESMKNYFEYLPSYSSGVIPEITLTGESEDYVNILKRIDQIEQLIPEFAVTEYL